MSKRNLVIIMIVLLIIGIGLGIFIYINGSEDKVKEVPTYIVGVEDLYCNIKDSKKMVKINIVIETKDEELKENMENQKFLIRDLTNEIVVSKTEEELLVENGQRVLKEEILKDLAETFESEEIINIYFNDFIIQ